MQFPNEFIQPSKCLITSKTFTELTDYGFNIEVAKRGNPHKWLIDFTTRKLSHHNSREVQAFLDSLDGRYVTFTLPCPLPFMGGTNSFSVVGSNAAGSNQVNVDGLPNSTVKALMAGDFIKFDNHDKCYKIIESLDSNGVGAGVMKIHPRLQFNINDNDVISEGVFTLRMTKDTTGLSLSGKVHEIIKVSAIEA